jgi:precorrin-6A/cobalt-precorrin-6A reductase
MGHGLPLRVLILGGTVEASALARLAAAEPGLAPILSLAGRTASPLLPAIPSRIGGFGGAAGLAAYLRHAAIDRLIDATHPFAHQISSNAAQAAALADVPRLVLCRPPWVAGPSDDWRMVPTMQAAALALGAARRRVFLTIGRQELRPFQAMAAHHHYLIRSVDPPDPALLPPRAEVITARGPFPEAAERALMERHGIDVLVTKNSGGADGKLSAARALGRPVVMVERQPAPVGETVAGAHAALAWLQTHATERPLPEEPAAGEPAAEERGA